MLTLNDPQNLPVLIIGYGNTLRGDDGVGVYIAQTLAQEGWEGVKCLAVHQLTPELAQDIAQSQMVIFVDAIDSNSTTVEIHSLQPEATEIKWGHTGNPRSLLSLAHTLYGNAPQGWWVLIPGQNFGFSEDLSPFTQGLLPQAIKMIQDIILQSLDCYKDS